MVIPVEKEAEATHTGTDGEKGRADQGEHERWGINHKRNRRPEIHSGRGTVQSFICMVRNNSSAADVIKIIALSTQIFKTKTEIPLFRNIS